MIDLSMQGAKLYLTGGGLAGNIVLEFSDEGTPIDFPDLEVCGYAMTMNGELVTWTKPTPITFTLTVIPGSKSDELLRKLLYAGHVGGRKGKRVSQAVVYLSEAVLEVPSITTNDSAVSTSSTLKFKFANGRLSGGNPAIGSNAEGKMTARTYRFVFESVSSDKTTV